MKKFHLVCLALMLYSFASEAAVRIPSFFGDGMILQRDEPIKVWGWADSGEEVTVSWNNEICSTTANANGHWEVTLSPTKAGGPYTMAIGDILIKDILVGDVFLCSGQSNMELPVARVMDMFSEEVLSYENTQIRQIQIPQTFNFNNPQEDTPETSWKSLTQDNVMSFSALAYFYAKEMHAATGVPVGIVNASWGGTPIEAWTSEDALKERFPQFINAKRIYEDAGYRDRIKGLEGENFYRWNTALDQGDPGLNGPLPWYSPEFDDKGWKKVEMFSNSWGNDGLNPVGGSHWLRKDVTIPAHWEGKEAIIRMGCIVDADSVYVNGHFVGNTTYQYPPRIYRIPAGVLKRGKNNVTVRVISNGGQPSFVPEKPYKIICGKDEISLEGTWKYHPGAQMPPAPSMMFFFYKPVCLYNSMIHPLRNMKFAGVLWYQGESNVTGRNIYADQLVTMMEDWRKTFADKDLIFYIVELADFLHESDVEGRRAWAELREQQAEAVRKDGKSRLIRNSDLGEWNDIHPLDKKTLGQRAAEATLKDLKNN